MDTITSQPRRPSPTDQTNVHPDYVPAAVDAQHIGSLSYNPRLIGQSDGSRSFPMGPPYPDGSTANMDRRHSERSGSDSYYEKSGELEKNGSRINEPQWTKPQDSPTSGPRPGRLRRIYNAIFDIDEMPASTSSPNTGYGCSGDLGAGSGDKGRVHSGEPHAGSSGNKKHMHVSEIFFGSGDKKDNHLKAYAHYDKPTVAYHLLPTLDHAIREETRFLKEAKFFHFVVLTCVILQVVVGTLITAFSASFSGRLAQITTTTLGGINTLMAAIIARAHSANEPTLSANHVKDLQKFVRECEAFLRDHAEKNIKTTKGVGETDPEDFTQEVMEFRKQFEELLHAPSNTQRKAAATPSAAR